VLTFSPAARAGVALAALLLVAMLATLIAVLVSLESTRSEIRTTRAGVVDTDQRLQRASRQLQPLLGGEARRRIGSTAGALGHALDQLPEAARRARQGVDAATFLASTLDEAQLPRALTSLRTLADAALTAARPGVHSLDACDASLRRRPPGASGQLGCLLRTVPNIRALLRSQRRLNRKSTTTQLRQLSLMQRTYELLAQSLAIQRETLEHARSIDRKTGGTAPAGPLGGG
jgi:hypothetical protein